MNRRSFLGASSSIAFAAAQDMSAEDEYGGLKSVSLEGTGRFRLADWRGARWLVTPNGHPFSAVGLCHAQMPPRRLRVAADTTLTRFGDDPKRYAEDLLPWMSSAGFNTFSYGVPAFTEGKMNRLSELQLVPGFINGPQFPDFFDPLWRGEVAAKIAKLVPPAARDPRVIGHVLSSPLLFSPQMERPRIWRNGEIKRQNYLMAVRALPDSAPGKKAYLRFFRRSSPPSSEEYSVLHAEEAAFYTHMWDDLTRFIVAEIRKHDRSGLILSYRFIRVLTWPDPWLDAMLAGVGPHVDAFAVELYGDNPFRAVVDGIGQQTGKPSLILDGMRKQEFVYADLADDRAEAADYETMYRSLLGSRWFLGSSVCEYRQKLPNNPYYSPRPNDARTGVRNPDFTERTPLLAAFRKLHPARYQMRLASLAPQV